jgi:UDP-N-acetyl-D-glucosamine dehydrogenase
VDKSVIVIGQGYVGLPIAISAAEAGFRVIGFDIDGEKIKELRLGISGTPDVESNQLIKLQQSGILVFTNKLEKQSQNSVFVIAVPTPLNDERKPDLSMLRSACEIIGENISSNSLLINESTSYIGTLRDFIKPIIDSKSGLRDIKYAVAPERIDPGNSIWRIGNTPRLVSGLDSASTLEAVDFYSKICSKVVNVSMPEVAEAAKLFENTFRLVNIALTMSLSKLAHLYGTTAHEIISAAATKPFGFVPFYPSVGIGGHCIPVDPKYLTFSGLNRGLDLELINVSDQINLQAPNYIIDYIKINYFDSLKNKKIQIAGISYKTDCSDLRESKSIELIELLRKEGAEVIWHDPLVSSYKNEISQPLSSEVDIGLLVTPHKIMDFSPWLESRVMVLDLSSTPTNFGWVKAL